MRALLVVNPVATTTDRRTLDVLTSALASETKLEVVATTGRGHAVELGRQAAEDGLDLVVVLGGDGTINEIVNGLLHGGPATDLPALGVVPGGSTNVFARAVGLPNSPIEATAALLEALRVGSARSLGMGRANDRWFTFTAGVGLDADAVRLVERARARGRRSTPQLYALSAARRFFRSDRRHPHLTVRLPGHEPMTGLFLTIVSNTAPWTYINRRPVTMTTTASFDRGLDVVALRRLRTFGTLLVAGRMLTRDGIRGRQVLTLIDQPDLIVEAACPMPIQVDGDYLGTVSRVHFRSVPDALRVLVPAEQPPFADLGGRSRPSRESDRLCDQSPCDQRHTVTRRFRPGSCLPTASTWA